MMPGTLEALDFMVEMRRAAPGACPLSHFHRVAELRESAMFVPPPRPAKRFNNSDAAKSVGNLAELRTTLSPEEHDSMNT